MFPGVSIARHPVPAALDWLEFDRFTVDRPARIIVLPGAMEYTVASEDPANPEMMTPIGDFWSRAAAQQRDAFWQRVLRDRCAAREALQVANGGKAEPDGVCQGAPMRDEGTTGRGTSRPSSVIPLPSSIIRHPSSLVMTPEARR